MTALDISLFDWIGPVFSTLSQWQIGGVSITAVIIFLLVITGIAFLIRGNK